MNYVYQVELFHQQRYLGRFMTGNNFPEKDLLIFLNNILSQNIEFKVYKGVNERRILVVENEVTKVISTQYDFEIYHEWKYKNDKFN